MDLGNIISYSFKYPFNDFKNLTVCCALFLLPIVSLLLLLLENDILSIVSIIIFAIFLLILPGYFISVVKKGCEESLEIPGINLKLNIVNTFKLIILNIVYMIIPVVIFLILLVATGLASFIAADLNMATLSEAQVVNMLSSLGITVVVSMIFFIIFTILFYIATARLSASGSLSDALSFRGVWADIKEIGFGKVIGWYVVMGILVGIVERVAFLLVLIPYVGIVIYLCVIIPILLLIFSYSMGLLYSNAFDVGDIDAFEKEIHSLRVSKKEIE